MPVTVTASRSDGVVAVAPSSFCPYARFACVTASVVPSATDSALSEKPVAAVASIATLSPTVTFSKRAVE